MHYAKKRRQFLVNTAALAVSAALPIGARGQAAPVKIGVVTACPSSGAIKR